MTHENQIPIPPETCSYLLLKNMLDGIMKAPLLGGILMTQELLGGPLDGAIVELNETTALYTAFPVEQRGCVYGLHEDRRFHFIRQMTRDETKRECKR